MFLYLDYSRYIYSFSKPWGCYVYMCVCKFYECFLSLEAVCVCLYACIDVRSLTHHPSSQGWASRCP